MMRYITALLCLFAFHCHANLVIGGTRFVYQENQPELSISVNNSTDKADLVQSWVSDPQGNKSKHFLMTPPIFRLDGGMSGTVKLTYLGGITEKNKESLFWVNIKGIPEKPQGMENYIQIAINSKMKLFYRPDNLPISFKDAQQNIKWKIENNTLVAENPTPYYITVNSVSLLAEDFKGKMIAPGATEKLGKPLKQAQQVSYKTISEAGGEMGPYQKNLE